VKLARSIEKLGSVEELPKLGELQSISRPSFTLPGAPRQPGRARVEDPLEKAAVRGVTASLPERIVWKWLLEHDYLFDVQQVEAGGRLVAGGAVVDFIVYAIADRPVVIRVQGEYWHGPRFLGRQARDDEQAGRLRLQGYLVVDLWEQDIYDAVRWDRLNSWMLEQLGQ
jgi:hypothetical protein